MKDANFLLLEDNVSVYEKADTTSAEVAKLNSGDEIICDERFRKHQIHWSTVVLPDNRKGYMLADTKGFKIALMVLTQDSADVYEAPDALSKVVFTYNKDDKFQLIGSVKQGDVLWIKTESLTGVIGFVQGTVKGKQETQITPSQKWPFQIGIVAGIIGAAIMILLYVLEHSHAGDSIAFDCSVGFFIGFIAGYLPSMLFMRIRRSILR